MIFTEAGAKMMCQAFALFFGANTNFPDTTGFEEGGEVGRKRRRKRKQRQKEYLRSKSGDIQSKKLHYKKHLYATLFYTAGVKDAFEMDNK